MEREHYASSGDHKRQSVECSQQTRQAETAGVGRELWGARISKNEGVLSNIERNLERKSGV